MLLAPFPERTRPSRVERMRSRRIPPHFPARGPDVTAYTILPGSSRSSEVQVVVAVLQQYVGSVPEVDNTSLVVGERNAELLIGVLCDARFPFVQLRRNILLFVHLDQHLPCLLYRHYLGQILHR